MDPDDGQERALGGQPGCGDASEHAQTKGAKTQLALHKL